MTDFNRFNIVLKKYLNEVKVMEKTHPKKSLPLWINIVQYIVTFAKTKDCPIMMRKKLVYQAEAILERIKGLQAQLMPIPNSTVATLQSGEISSKNKLSQTNISEIDLQSLPDVPIFSPEDDIKDIPSCSERKDNMINNLTLSPNQPSFNINKPQSSDESLDLNNLAKLEEELKKMPVNLKEISPTLLNMPVSQIREELTLLDITSQEVGTNLAKSENIIDKKNNNEPRFQIKGLKDNIPGSPIIPLQNNLSEPNTPDAFGPKSLQNPENHTEKLNKGTCFACGAAIEPEDKVCGQCGTPITPSKNE